MMNILKVDAGLITSIFLSLSRKFVTVQIFIVVLACSFDAKN